MKRSIAVLGILGLVYAVVLPGASAGVLWQPDLSKGKLDPPAGSTIYTQAVNDATKGADDTTKNNPGIKPFVVLTDKDVDNVFDNSCTCNKAAGWLDNGDSDGTTTHDLTEDATEKTYVSMLLTGDPKWADVSMQCKMDVFNQNTGTWGMVLRAAPKTKPDDPDSYYVLQYRSHGGTDEQLDSEIRDGIPACASMVKNRDGDGDEDICMRILKVVKGKWTMLADQGAATSNVHIPRLNRLGVDHDTNTDPSSDGNGADALTGYYFRFVAKGNQLTGFVSKDGQKWDQVLQATDSELTAGQVGFMHYNYRPLTKEILVEDAP
jgi:hypothetical protein